MIRFIKPAFGGSLSFFLYMVVLCPPLGGSDDILVCPVLAPPSPVLAQPFVGSQPLRSKEDAFQDPPTPVVSVKMRVPAEVILGKELEYKILVENSSTSPAHHVVLRDALPAGVKYVRASPEPNVKDPELIWRLGTLNGGGKQEIAIVVMPSAAGAIANCARVQFEHGQCTTTRVLKPAIQVRREGPKEGILGDVVKFKLTITNSGDTDLTNVKLEEALPAGLEHASGQKMLRWEMSLLPPGDSESTEYEVKITAATKLCSKATVQANDDLKDEYESCLQAVEPKMKVMKSGPDKRYVNLPAIYQITVENAGTIPLKGVSITDQVPLKASFVRASDNGEAKDNVVTWTLGDLEPGVSKTVELELKAVSEGAIVNQAIARADHGVEQQAAVKTTFAGVAALTLDVQHDNDPLEVGGAITYDIKVSNPGSSAARNVLVTVQAPDQLEITRAAGDSDPERVGSDIHFAGISIPAGGTARYRVYAKAIKPGVHVRMRVRLEADELRGGPVEQEEVATIYAAMPVSLRKRPRTEPAQVSRLKQVP
jgi:uncharacterized repeat protein (TIGR01451 family)